MDWRARTCFSVQKLPMLPAVEFTLAAAPVPCPIGWMPAQNSVAVHWIFQPLVLHRWATVKLGERGLIWRPP